MLCLVVWQREVGRLHGLSKMQDASVDVARSIGRCIHALCSVFARTTLYMHAPCLRALPLPGAPSGAADTGNV